MTARKHKQDSTIYFDLERKTGVLIQHQFRRAIYFSNGEKKDELQWHWDTPASSVETWIEAKRNIKKEKAQVSAPV